MPIKSYEGGGGGRIPRPPLPSMKITIKNSPWGIGLRYRYKGKTPDENFNTYDNALNLIDKIKNDEVKLAEAKNDQIKFKSVLGEIKKMKQQKKIKRAK